INDLARRCGQFRGFEWKRKLSTAPAPCRADLLPVFVPSDPIPTFDDLRLKAQDDCCLCPRHPRQPSTQGNDPMSYISNVIQQNQRSRMSCIISVRMPSDLIAILDAEAQKSGCSTSEIIRQLLQFALDVRHREK